MLRLIVVSISSLLSGFNRLLPVIVVSEYILLGGRYSLLLIIIFFESSSLSSLNADLLIVVSQSILLGGLNGPVSMWQRNFGGLLVLLNFSQMIHYVETTRLALLLLFVFDFSLVFAFLSIIGRDKAVKFLVKRCFSLDYTI